MSLPPDRIVAKPRLLFRPNPVLGWSLTPDHGVQVRFRPDIVQNVGPNGWRFTPGSLENERPRLAIYGCSFTYGTGLADDETFVALLQKGLPDVRMMNRGIGGHGTVQNYLQFRRDVLSHEVDAAVFAIFSDHRFRNVPHPRRMRQFLKYEWYELGVEHVPVLRQGRAGQRKIEYIPIWQPAQHRGDFGVFLPDDHMIDTATFSILAEVFKLGQAHNVPVLLALLDQQDGAFNKALLKRFDMTVDVSVPLNRAHTFRPIDMHPNQKAAALYAERLLVPTKSLLKKAKLNA